MKNTQLQKILGHEKMRAKAIRLIDRLQAMLNQAGGTTILCASIEIGEHALSLRIGDLTVWNSEEHSEKELTIKHCRCAISDHREVLGFAQTSLIRMTK